MQQATSTTFETAHFKGHLLKTLAALSIIALSFLLRLSYNDNTLLVSPIGGDAARYTKYATNLIEHATFSKQRGDNPTPDSYWAPGYPLFLAAIIKISDYLDRRFYQVLLFLQAVIGAGTVALCYLIGRTFLPSYWPLAPTLLCAISPHLISVGLYPLTETLFCFLLTGSIYLMIQSIVNYSKLLSLFSGIGFGLCYLVNPITLLLPIILCAIPIVSKPGPNLPSITLLKPGKLTLLVILPTLLLSAGWSVRNYIIVPHDQQAASDRLFDNLIAGVYPDYHEKWRASRMQQDVTIEIPGEKIDKNLKSFLEASASSIKSNPVNYMKWYAIEKPWLLWSWNIMVGQGDIYINPVIYSLYDISKPALASYSLMKALHPWLFFFSILGAVYAIKDQTAVAPKLLYSTAIYVSAVYVITQSEPRYSIPLRPELYLCATYFIMHFSRTIKVKLVASSNKDLNN